jgi:hypothetical protein
MAVLSFLPFVIAKTVAGRHFYGYLSVSLSAVTAGCSLEWEPLAYSERTVSPLLVLDFPFLLVVELS